MEEAGRKKTLTIATSLLIVVVASGVIWFGRGGESGGVSEKETSKETRYPVPSDTFVPDKNSAVSGDVASPSQVVPVIPGSSQSFRVFEIFAERDKFSPDTIIVKEGDSVRINLKAVDHDYYFTQPDYGFAVLIRKGQISDIPFQASASGKFLFYCESCGGLERGPIGSIVVVPK